MAIFLTGSTGISELLAADWFRRPSRIHLNLIVAREKQQEGRERNALCNLSR